ncbi:hypothetical protein [Iodidimonas sp. SYSU 1G8]|uniref:hypothetical protein n=1 Tax=Iodidimonas sp. SYSU 1G8 TaxID=3133967 RepID=UPI0031FE5B03
MSSVGALYKPKAVSRAVNLFSLAVVVGVAMVAADFFHFRSGLLETAPLAVFAVIYALATALTMMVSSRMGFARLVFLGLYLIVLVPAIYEILAMLEKNVVIALLLGAQLVLAAIGFLYLFRRHATLWFGDAGNG